MASAETVIPRVRAELCDDLVRDRISAWGPGEKRGGSGFIYSWTDTVSKDIGSTRHYINCLGESDGRQCLGRWSRRDRELLSPGLYCVFGSHVLFDGNTISETRSAEDGRSLKRLRHLWAEHVLRSSSLNGSNHNGSSHNGNGHNGNIQNGNSHNGNDLGQTANQSAGGALVTQAELDMMRAFLQKAIAKSAAIDEAKKLSDDGQSQKALGKGAAGREGVTEAGVVWKRDTGDSVLGNGQDECYKEPGGFFERGDLEVWVTWHGWSSLGVRDGRWRPGFHFEILLGLFTTVIDYGTNRKLWRARDKPWVMAAEWIWRDTPNDVHELFAQGVVKDLREIFRREVGRVQNVTPLTYQVDKGESREAQYPLLLDRGGEYIATHLVGQPLTSDRGYLLAWILCVPNDIQDYERDVLCGETNNLVRAITSAQQVVDAAYMLLLIAEGVYAHKDYDLLDAILGVSAYFLITWRYNTPKQFKLYEAISIRDRLFERPPETVALVDLVRQHYPTTSSSSGRGVDDTRTYGDLFDAVAAATKKSHDGCTCGDAKPRGHDTWAMLRQALDEGDNEALEEQMHVEFSHLSIGASHGDIRCECGLDLAAYEGFTRFFDPDTGLVSRLHYKTSTADGNSLAE